MYVITVEFTIHTQHLGAFMPLMQENARVSRESERGCLRFDLCRDPARPQCVFLYEVYDDRAAFEAHLATPHFKAFDAAAKAMVANKAVRALELVNS
ncbi:MAG: antibiotic biosynthesis monooxygenase [Betaproteobacteria bacterium]|nr:MAG: antibiotic biosynthesis monooxygenase [Betaproteobacteria bacterium]